MFNDFDVYDDNEKCKCGQPGSANAHTCPYAEEIGGDYESECNCCSSCESDCCMDI